MQPDLTCYNLTWPAWSPKPLGQVIWPDSDPDMLSLVIIPKGVGYGRGTGGMLRISRTWPETSVPPRFYCLCIVFVFSGHLLRCRQRILIHAD